MSDRLDGKVIIVTGVASAAGIGWAIAHRLGAEGARLVVTDVDPAGAQRCAASLADAGAEAIGLGQDVTDEAGWTRVVDAATDRFGALDGLVNNAGIADLAPLEEVTPAAFRRQVDINLTGPFLGCAAAVKAIRRHGRGGAIVNISSVAGLVGFASAAGYSASKGGLRVMTKAIAIELAPEGIRCNSVHPGAIETDMLKNVSTMDPERHQAIIASLPMRKLGKVDDIAASVAYLLSDEATYVTGAEFAIDGGQTAQ